MFQTPLRIALIAFFSVATVALVWLLIDQWGEPRIKLDPYRQLLAKQVVHDVVWELPRRDEIRRLVVVPIVRDVDERVTDLLYDALYERDLFFLANQSDVRSVIENKFNDREPLNIAEAVAVGRAMAADDTSIQGVLFPVLSAFSPGREGVGARVELKAWLVRLDSAATVPGGTVVSTTEMASRWDLDWFAAYAQSSSRFWRMVLWLLLTTGLPFALFPVVKAALAMDNNRANGALLGGLVAASTMWALVLMGLRPGWSGAALLVIAALGAFVYSFGICDWIDEKRR